MSKDDRSRDAAVPSFNFPEWKMAWDNAWDNSWNNAWDNGWNNSMPVIDSKKSEPKFIQPKQLAEMKAKLLLLGTQPSVAVSTTVDHSGTQLRKFARVRKTA